MAVSRATSTVSGEKTDSCGKPANADAGRSIANLRSTLIICHGLLLLLRELEARRS